MVAAYQGGRWERLCGLLESEDLANDPRFATSSLRVANRTAMRDALSTIFRTRDSAYWLAALEREDILCAKVATYDDVQQNALFSHLQMIVELKDDHGRMIRFPGFPVNCSENQSVPHRPPPRLDEHRAEILAELGHDQTPKKSAKSYESHR